MTEAVWPQAVWKYPIPTNSPFSISMPMDANILTIRTQYELPFLWALVHPTKPLEERHFLLVATGEVFNPTAENMRYVGTFLVEGEQLVFHLFERFLQ